MVVAEPRYIRERSRRPLGPPVPGEGVGEVFTQSWFPICLSADLRPEVCSGSIFSTVV